MLGSDTPPSERLIHSVLQTRINERLFRYPTVGTPDTLPALRRDPAGQVPIPHRRNA